MKLFVSLIFIITFVGSSSAQVFLQIEKINSPKTIKLLPGNSLEYTLKEYPNVWRREIIQSIDYEQNLIVLEEGYRNIDEIRQLRLYNPWAKSIGNGLLQFSAGWYLFGGIATVADSGYTMSSREIAIGGIFAGVGLLIKKLIYKRTLTMEKNARLRIVDTRFYNPEYGP